MRWFRYKDRVQYLGAIWYVTDVGYSSIEITAPNGCVKHFAQSDFRYNAKDDIWLLKG